MHDRSSDHDQSEARPHPQIPAQRTEGTAGRSVPPQRTGDADGGTSW
ncbi:hypothetical protein [Streptomyces filamentosus]